MDPSKYNKLLEDTSKNFKKLLKANAMALESIPDDVQIDKAGIKRDLNDIMACVKNNDTDKLTELSKKYASYLTK
jgi:predicted transcriptional regulator